MPTPTLKLSRKEICALRAPNCEWSEDGIAEAIEKRFPGGKPVDVAKLIDAWIADTTLSHAVLVQCALLARTMTKRRLGGPMCRLQPRKALEHLAAKLAEPAPTETP